MKLKIILALLLCCNLAFADTDFSPGQDGAWNMDEDGFGGSSCVGITNTGTTEQLTDTHSLDPAIFSEGGLDFDTSSIPDTDTITSVTLKIYRNSFSKSKSLDTNYSVGYSSTKNPLSSPMVCSDRNLTWTSEGSGNWANTTGYFNQTIATTSINLTGHTTFRLIPNWLHVADTLFKTATWRTQNHATSSTRPVLTVVHGAASTNHFLSSLGVGN